MATKKSASTKAKNASRPSSSAKKTSRASARNFDCPNPGKPMDLRKIIKKMSSSGKFARFIQFLLCESRQTGRPQDAARATACLKTYFDVESVNTFELCLPARVEKRLARCTDHFALLASPAYAFSDESTAKGRTSKRASKA